MLYLAEFNPRGIREATIKHLLFKFAGLDQDLPGGQQSGIAQITKYRLSLALFMFKHVRCQ